MTFEEARKKYKKFYYTSYTITHTQQTLRMTFHFTVDSCFSYTPEIVFRQIQTEDIERLGVAVLHNLAFHLGLIEMFSYWKATCAPEIIIEAGYLTSEQIAWWKQLLIHGMGEYFYTNTIDFTPSDFVHISTNMKTQTMSSVYTKPLNDTHLLIPVGGGKDSAVTCELLRAEQTPRSGMCLNPTKAALDTLKAAGIHHTVQVQRSIDRSLLEQNARGFLNGHTPFSAYLGFLSVACGLLYNYKTILVSNESSANEGNVLFHGNEINHQYSKSFAFEKMFQQYVRIYIATDISYFSFLRPLLEIQIAKIFSHYPTYFPYFRSCNKGQKTNTWCCACAKCLFSYTILFPFLSPNNLAQIFPSSLFEIPSMIPLAEQLVQTETTKPFDCVGTRKETILAFSLCIRNIKKTHATLPPVLLAMEKLIKQRKNESVQQANRLFHAWNTDNQLPHHFQHLLKQALAV